MPVINASHGGHSGDLIYGLAFAKELASRHRTLVDLYLASDRPSPLSPRFNHPNGHTFCLSTGAYDFVRPLIAIQPFVNSVSFVPDAKIPVDAIRLDPYRFTRDLNSGAGNIVDYPGKLYGVAVDASRPWLATRPVKRSDSRLTLSFSKRYRNGAIDYSFIAELERVRFIGLPEEFEDFRRRHGLANLSYWPCSDALEFAEAIASSDLFLGNQSLGFAIAEGLKVRRVLEVCEKVPNVVPCGRDGGSFIYQSGLMNLLSGWGISVSGARFQDRTPAWIDVLPDA
jgi:hypothetical protein